MFVALFRPWKAQGWRRAALMGAAVVVAVGTVWYFRGGTSHRAAAQTTPVAQPAATQQGFPSDYSSRVVAYIHQNQAITRQELGEYLIARYGVEKLGLLVNKRLLDRACQARHIVVTAAEVEAALADELKGLAIDHATFMKSVLTRYKKNLYEFKEDILRPRLQLTRLCQPDVTATPDDLKKAFESGYGDKVECRLIMWPLEKQHQAESQYAALRDSEDAFANAAKNQSESSLASSGGRIKPITRWSLDPAIEKAAFELRPGEVSTLIKTTQGIVLVKCDRRIPADTTITFDAVKEKLAGEIREAKLQFEMGKAFAGLREQSRPTLLLKKSDRAEAGPMPPPNQVVATIQPDETVTREELGEFLIARLGGDKLAFLVNRRILALACQEKNVSVTDEQIEQGIDEDLKLLDGVDRKYFEEKILPKWGKNLFEWREDVVRPRLLMNKLAESRVEVTAEDLQKGFEARYGERLECRMILWPPEQARLALREYARVRDSESEFERMAKAQASPTLSGQGGKLPIFGRHTLGDESLEREAFRLQPGEITPLIGTPQGQAVIKCDRRIPPDTTRKLEQEQAELTREIHKKKTQILAQAVFKELHDRATPRMLLAGTGQPEDLAEQTRKLTSDLPALGSAVPRR